MKGKRYNWSQIILWVITFLVVLSMVLGYLLSTLTPPKP
jgi:hypothetical protein